MHLCRLKKPREHILLLVMGEKRKLLLHDGLTIAA